MLNIKKIREDFPIFKQKIGEHYLHYLDSAATAQKPRAVLDAMTYYYEHHNANPHRGISFLTQKATEHYEESRKTVANFIGTDNPDQVVFTKNTTEALNLVAYGWARTHLKPGDQILVSEMEHHSNLIPWQMAAKATGATLQFIPVSRNGEIDSEEAVKMITDKVRLVAITHISNVFGTETNLAPIIQSAHLHGAIVVVDGAQAAPHISINVEALDADFYAFSGHKLYGPMGIGALYGKKELLDQTEPLLYGGQMILSANFDHATWAETPRKFEGGTQHVAGTVGLAAAIKHLKQVSWDSIAEHEDALVEQTITELSKLPEVTLLVSENRGNHHAMVSFTVEGIHAHDVSQVLDTFGVAVRSGHHCVQPFLHKIGVDSTIRASFGIYNDETDVEALITGVKAAIKRFMR